MARAKRILYSINGHGFGHGTRSLLVAALLIDQVEDLEIVLSTTLGQQAIDGFGIPFRRPCLLRAAEYEPGTLQKNCFEVNVEATRASYRSWAGELDQRLDRERTYLADNGIDAVISDISPLSIAAAAELGLPTVALSNFTWDWILAPLFDGEKDLESLVKRFARDYSRASLYLRLPLHAREHPFARVEPAPLLGRVSSRSRQEVLDRLGMDPRDPRPVVLVAAGGWRAEGWSPIEVQGCHDFRFVLVDHLPVTLEKAEGVTIPFDLPAGLLFHDLVHAADLGIVKPGYGTCSEFLLNGTRMVGIERTDFREYEVLTAGMLERAPFVELSLEDFFAGRWEGALEAIQRRPVVTSAPDDAEHRELVETLKDTLVI